MTLFLIIISVCTLVFGGLYLNQATLGVGVIGEYVVRIYDEVKKRPAYVVDQIVSAGQRREVPAASAAGAVVYSDSDERRERGLLFGGASGRRGHGTVPVPE